MDSEVIRRELDAINEKWRESQNGSKRKGDASGDLLSPPHPSIASTSIPNSGEGSDNIWVPSSAPLVTSRQFFPNASSYRSRLCDDAVKGWLILPVPGLPDSFTL